MSLVCVLNLLILQAVRERCSPEKPFTNRCLSRSPDLPTSRFAKKLVQQEPRPLISGSDGDLERLLALQSLGILRLRLKFPDGDGR